MLQNASMAEEVIELREYDSKSIEFKTVWVLEELKVEEAQLRKGARYFVDFLDENGIVQFSVGSESKRIRHEFKTDTFMKESDRQKTQKRVVKSLFMDTFKSKATAQTPAEMRVNSMPNRPFVGPRMLIPESQDDPCQWPQCNSSSQIQRPAGCQYHRE